MTDAADEEEEGGDLLDDDEEGAALQPMGFGEDDDFAWLNGDLFDVDFDIESLVRHLSSSFICQRYLHLKKRGVMEGLGLQIY